MSSRFLTIRLEGELFGLPAELVEEVLPDLQVKVLPGLPVHVVGVLNHRGNWIPLLDAGPPLGLPQGDRVNAVVLKRGRIRYALGIDGVAGIRDAGDTSDADIITPLDPDTLFAAQLPAGEEQDAMADPQTRAAPVAAVVFKLGAHELGIEISQVHEVLNWRAPAPVPRAPSFIEGVIDLRGEVVPVVDMRKRLGLAAPDPGPDTRIVVVGFGDERIGLVVDHVSEVSRIPDTAISKAPKYFRGLTAELIQGLARFGDRLVVLIHIDRILNSDERIALSDSELAEEVEGGAEDETPGEQPPATPRRRRTRGHGA